MTHGSKNHRAPGAIGMELRLVVYYLVKKMAGQLGNKITTIQKLKVIQIDLEENILVIKDLFQENLVTY
jgi:large subunit ribosomal protein L3